MIVRAPILISTVTARTVLVLQGNLDGVTRPQLGIFACENPFRSLLAFFR
ncbi:hypothetical protein ACVWW6_003937 [Bradyrhizobium sp. USDA 3311]|jgi:hypothetical protein